MLGKILIPLDGSALSKQILQHVRRILLRQDAEVTLVRVVPSDEPGSLQPTVREELEEATRSIDGVCRQLLAEGARARAVIRRGDEAGAILAFADEYQPSLIAMSTHGRSGFGRWVWGSVTERVVRSSRHPLLLANPKALESETFPRDLGFHRILVPLDGSDVSAKVLPLVQEIALLYESEVTLFHCKQLTAASCQTMSPEVTSLEPGGETLLAPYQEHLAAAGVRVRAEVSYEAPARGILERLQGGGIDLVAMTTHGRSGYSRWALGSVAEKVIRRCPCPALICRTAVAKETL